MIEQLTIAGFIILFLVIAWLHRKATLSEFSFAGAKTTLIPLLCSILASYIGGGLIIGIVTFGYEGGMVGVIIGVSYCLALFLTGVFAPSIKALAIQHKFVSFHDFIEHTHGKACKRIVIVVNFLIFFFFLAAQFVALASLLNTVYQWNFPLVLLSAAVVLIAYTAISGLKGVFVTDKWQLLILTGVMFIIVLPVAFEKSDSLSALRALPPVHWSGLGMGVVFAVGALLFSGLTILVRADAWQRIFAAQDASTSRRAFYWAAAWILPFFLLYTFLGMHAKVLFPEVDAADEVFSNLLLNYFSSSVWLLVVICSIVAAIISSADSLLNVLAVNVVRDSQRWGDTWKSHAEAGYENADTDNMLKRRVQLCTIALGIAALIFALLLPDIVKLVIAATSGLLILLPVVIGGIVLKDPKPRAGLWSVTIGLLVLLGLFPVKPTEAFVPALLLSCISYLVLTKWDRQSHSSTDPG